MLLVCRVSCYVGRLVQRIALLQITYVRMLRTTWVILVWDMTVV